MVWLHHHTHQAFVHNHCLLSVPTCHPTTVHDNRLASAPQHHSDRKCRKTVPVADTHGRGNQPHERPTARDVRKHHKRVRSPSKPSEHSPPNPSPSRSPRRERLRSHSQPSPIPRVQPASRILFYHRHQPYFEFTSFAPYNIYWDGRMYPTAEHLFQAHKFMPHRPDLAERIRHLPSPRAALEEAGRLRGLQRPDWFDVNISVMDAVVEAKFTQHLSLRDKLLGTGDSELIEDSPVDSFWGWGPDKRGRNELGKALMRLRAKLRALLASASGRLVWSSPAPNDGARAEGHPPGQPSGSAGRAAVHSSPAPAMRHQSRPPRRRAEHVTFLAT